MTLNLNAHVSPVIPDITHPILSVILKRWVTVEASRSLSYSREERKEDRVVLDAFGTFI